MSLKFESGVSLFFNFFSQNVLRKLKEKSYIHHIEVHL